MKRTTATRSDEVIKLVDLSHISRQCVGYILSLSVINEREGQSLLLFL